VAAAIYITVCVVSALVRWFHMCRPQNIRPQYYYPARPYLTGAWVSSLALIPFVLHPDSPDAWFLARFYFLPVTLFHFPMILFSYFGSVMQWRKWRRPVLFSGIPVAIVLVVAIVLAFVPGDQLGGTRLATFLLYVMGLFITALFFTCIVVINGWANRFDPEDYSNPADFPVVQARRWTMIVLLNLVLCWTGAFLNSPSALSVIMLIIAASSVLSLITALGPSRHRPLEEEPSPAAGEASADNNHRPLPKIKQQEMLAAIRTVVEEREGFLDPHLTLQDVAEHCGYSRTYISGLVKSELGGFATYVNRLRLAYVDDYLQKHPEAPLSEAIEAAGFSSRPRYYDAKSKL
jgi:AraC-like DNA-binding protein